MMEKLKPGEIHLWTLRLDHPGVPPATLWRLLSSDEQARAKRFHFERDRNHYVAGRGVLRMLIGRYLNLSPAQITFHYGSHGKPGLLPQTEQPHLEFNLSNAHGIALIGFCWDWLIGVDVEPVRHLDDGEAVAERFFSVAENEVFRKVAPEQKAEAFFNCWTRKEAFIKAVGEGLSYPLDQFDVTLAPGEPARMLCIRGSEETAAGWFLHSFIPIPGYIGAVAVPGKQWELHQFQWQ